MLDSGRLSLAQLAVRLSGQRDRDRDIWKMLAFLGRYAHQALSDMLATPMTDLQSLARATAEIMEEEYAQTRSSLNTD